MLHGNSVINNQLQDNIIYKNVFHITFLKQQPVPIHIFTKMKYLDNSYIFFANMIKNHSYVQGIIYCFMCYQR